MSLGNKTVYAETAVLNLLLRATAMGSPPGTVYAALFTVMPSSDAGTGGTEVSGNAYARQSITFGTVTTGTTTCSTSNTNTLLFPTATPAGWGTIVAAGIYDALTGGNLLYFDPVSPSVIINPGDQFQFKIGNFTVTED